MQRPVDYIHGRIGLLGMLALLALSPAICEEVLFRGFILSALRRRLPLWSGVIIVGLLFGAMHLNVYRLFAATLSGVVLTYLVWRSGSIVTSMIAHFIINGGLILLETNYIPRLTDALYVPVKDGGTLSPVVLGCAAAVLILGVVLMEWRTPRPSNA